MRRPPRGSVRPGQSGDPAARRRGARARSAPRPRGQQERDVPLRPPWCRPCASVGAQLFDLSTGRGLQAVFAKSGDTFQVFYIAPDGQAAVGGVMWGPNGHNITAARSRRSTAPSQRSRSAHLPPQSRYSQLRPRLQCRTCPQPALWRLSRRRLRHNRAGISATPVYVRRPAL